MPNALRGSLRPLHLLSNVEVSLTFQNKANFFVGMQMLLEEVPQLAIVVGQAFSGAGDLLMMMAVGAAH